MQPINNGGVVWTRVLQVVGISLLIISIYGLFSALGDGLPRLPDFLAGPFAAIPFYGFYGFYIGTGLVLIVFQWLVRYFWYKTRKTDWLDKLTFPLLWAVLALAVFTLFLLFLI